MFVSRIVTLAAMAIVASSAVLGSAPSSKRMGVSRRDAAHAQVSMHRRVTNEQQRQADELSCWQDALDEMNTNWQKAVQAGHVTDFQTFSNQHGGLPDPLKCIQECDDE